MKGQKAPSTVFLEAPHYLEMYMLERAAVVRSGTTEKSKHSD